MIGCQAAGCDALAEVKVREMRTDTGEIVWWRYLCQVHLEEEYGPWLRTMKGWREALSAAFERAMSTSTASPSSPSSNP